MSLVPFVQQYNEINSLCYSVIYDKIRKDVELYRYQLGYHFSFDFNYMLIRDQTNSEIILNGPGKRLRDYDLLLKYLWNSSVEEFIETKNMTYNKFQKEIKEAVDTFDQKDEYCILNHGDVEYDDFLTYMTKYFQIYVIKNIDLLNYDFNHYYNQSFNK